MRRKAGLVVPAVIVCLTLFWGSLSSAWAGAGFQPLLAEGPRKGALDYLAPNSGPRGVVGPPKVVQPVIVNTAELLEAAVVAYEVLMVVVELSTIFLGVLPSTGLATMTAQQAERIAQAEFDH
jgi:hypothetical protein